MRHRNRPRSSCLMGDDEDGRGDPESLSQAAELCADFLPKGNQIRDDVRKLRDRIRPAPGNLQREQFDLGKIPFTVP
jgi:hypothetical protein